MRAMCAIRKREEQDIGPADVLVVDEREACAFAEVGVSGGERLSGEGFAPGDDLVDVRVTEEKTQELTTRVPGGAHDRDLGQSRGSAAETRSRLTVSLLTALPLVARFVVTGRLSPPRGRSRRPSPGYSRRWCRSNCGTPWCS